MYAIVKSGGKQYRVEPGQRLLVERLSAEVGSTVTLEPLLYRSNEVVFEKDALAAVKVSAEVIGHERGEKIRVFKYKPKRGYRRRAGHRQELTRIEVRDIAAGGTGARRSSRSGDAAAKSRAAKGGPTAASAAEPAAKSEGPTGKPATGASTEPAASETKKPAARQDKKPAAARPRKPKEDDNGA
jgi:large subunit ribosomal protein L21